ncbi:MAG: hypothetical protein HYY16_08860, partial [Planctomycetes bacterium]|nr:hypothetical protein [Planctomycetota bacterium]
ITIGPMSGKSNIVYWLEKRGREAREDLVNAIFEKAKQSDHILTDAEVEGIVGGVRVEESEGNRGSREDSNPNTRGG